MKAEKLFTVVTGEVRHCGNIHWDCPFCDGEGSGQSPAPPYFYVMCESTNRGFLVQTPLEARMKPGHGYPKPHIQ